METEINNNDIIKYCIYPSSDEYIENDYKKIKDWMKTD